MYRSFERLGAKLGRRYSVTYYDINTNQRQLVKEQIIQGQGGCLLLPFAARLSFESIHCQGDDCTEPRGLIEHRFELGSFEFE